MIKKISVDPKMENQMSQLEIFAKMKLEEKGTSQLYFLMKTPKKGAKRARRTYEVADQPNKACLINKPELKSIIGESVRVVAKPHRIVERIQ
ncbi:unnamed protein product [Caenorhabditis angaria]|uniref:Uncharacterized protein n=1 Tax=Caenorhabditis angaria TaxID=860376 RepID=A0A9P1MZU4_9PELO|nr:unnamed protein product [Caenorhabditis angaria]